MKPRLTSFLMGQNESATSGGGETKVRLVKGTHSQCNVHIVS